MREKFFMFLNEVANKFEDLINENKSFLIITHIDADGLSSATLLTYYLYNSDANFHLTYVKHLDPKELSNILSRPEDVIVFLDLGSGILDKIKDFYSGKEIIIIDHHDLVIREKQIKNIIQVNPRLFGIDGSKEISTSGIIYFLLKSLKFDFEKISYLGLVGAIGDLQEDKELVGLNKQILDELVSNGVLEVKKGLKIFCSRPLHKALAYSAEIYIPGITGNEEKALEFLNRIGIKIKRKGGFTTYLDLSEEEVRKLVSEIIKLRLENNIENAEDVVGNLYIINNELRDLREVAYMFNATGRMGKPSLMILYFLGDKKYLDQALDIVYKYKLELINALTKIYNKEVEIKESGNIILIGLDVRDTLVSPIATILSKSIPKGKILVIYAPSNGEYKLSIRISGKNVDKSLATIVRQAAEKVGGCGGGHDVAAGAIIPKEKLNDFIKNLRSLARQEGLIF